MSKPCYIFSQNKNETKARRLLEEILYAYNFLIILMTKGSFIQKISLQVVDVPLEIFLDIQF